MMATNLALDELLNTAIVGPWLRHDHLLGDPNAKATVKVNKRQQFIYPTLVHWLEASKVNYTRKDLMEAVIFSPSIKEAQRLTRLNKTACRSDWNLIAHAIFSSALATLCLQRPQFGLEVAPIEEIARSLSDTGLSSNFINTSLIRFSDWRKGPRTCFIGADLAPKDIVGKKVAKTVASVGTWTLISTCNNRTPWQLHDWALAHHVPISYAGEVDDRMSKSLYHELIAKSSQVVVFERRGDRRHDTALRKVKELGKKLTLELFDARQSDGLLV